MRVEPFLISSVLNLIIAQRLVRKLCDDKEKYTLSAQDFEEISSYCNIAKVEEVLRQNKTLGPKQAFRDVTFFKPKPRSDCPDGYKGRVGIDEL